MTSNFSHHMYVHSFTGPTAITQKSAEHLYPILKSLLSSGHAVTLDFKGVETCGSQFFSASIAKLRIINIPEQLNARLRIVNLSVAQEDRLRRVIRLTKPHYLKVAPVDSD